MAVTTTIFLAAFYTILKMVGGKYVYIPENKTWDESQAYCRLHHADLALINSQRDQERILLASGAKAQLGWIGLYLVSVNSTDWNWSGAGPVMYTNWQVDQPNYWKDKQDKVIMSASGTWNDINKYHIRPFYCSELMVKTKLSWENALKYCKTRGKNLLALTWNNERLLVTSQMQREGVNLVWTGLRYLGQQWQWVSGAHLKPETQKEVSQCPAQERCGALNDKGQLQSWDCQDELYFIYD